MNVLDYGKRYVVSTKYFLNFSDPLKPGSLANYAFKNVNKIIKITLLDSSAASIIDGLLQLDKESSAELA